MNRDWIDYAGAIIAILGAVASWYYARQSKKEAKRANDLVESKYINDYIDIACNNYRFWSKEQISYIDTLGLSDARKEKIWKCCHQRCGGKSEYIPFSKAKKKPKKQKTHISFIS